MKAKPATDIKSKGCRCAGFGEAQTKRFIRYHDSHFYLANQEAASTSAISTWSTTLYGPEIGYCPFCGAKLKS
jgi:hypothetical protein